MMRFHAKAFVRAALAAALVLSSFQVSHAGTIIKLSLGDDAAPDIEFTGGVLSTVDDGIISPGEQDTAVEFLDFLSSIPNIPFGASYTLSGVTVVPGAGVEVIPLSTVLQPFTGGTFQLWDDAGTLLLGVALGNSQVSGNVGAPGVTPTGAVYSTTFSSPLPGAAGGILAPLITPGTIAFSIGMSNVNNGAGLSMTPLGSPVPGIAVGTLNDFTANVTKTIDAERLVPEPAAMLLFVAGLIGIPLRRWRA